MKKTINTRTKYKIVGSDYSGQELRLAAFLSQDKTLLDAYAHNKDAYAIIASQVFNVPYEECLEFYPEGKELEIDGKKVIAGNKTHLNVDGKARRSVGKTMVLAGNYGMSGAGAGSLMGKTAKEGTELLDKYFKMFSGLKNAIDASKENLKKQGYVEDIVGRRRRLPDIYLKPYDATYKDPNKLEKETFNPFISCKDRPVNDKVLNSYISRAQACRNNKDYEALSKEALANGVILQAYTGRIAQAERQCFNARIQGCLSENELIYTKNGIVKIGELAGKEIEVWDGQAWSKAHVEASGKKQKCKLITSIGQEIICSPDHRFLVVNTFGTESFKKLSEIKSQDRIIFNSSVPNISNKVSFRKSLGLTYTGPANKANYSFDDIKDNYIRGQILGRIASDGSYIKRVQGSSCIYLLVAEHEKELLEFFNKYLPYKYNLDFVQKKNQKVYRITICSTTLVEECLALDIKHQIHNLFYKNTDLLRGFISGFFDGDGTVNKTVQLDFGIQSDFTKITKQIQESLAAFGIRSKVHHYKDRYRVTVLRHEAKLFAERIGFITKEKQEKALKLVIVKNNKSFNNKVVVSIKSVEKTNEYINMYDVCDTDRGYFVVNGLVTHNSAGTLTKKAMIDIFNDEKLKEWDAHLIVTVHDEVLVECKEEFAEQVAERLPKLMINAAEELGIHEPKMKCDPYLVSRWYSDSMAGNILKEYSKVKEKGLSSEEAVNKVIENHSELPKEAIIKTVETGCDLEF